MKPRDRRAEKKLPRSATRAENRSLAGAPTRALVILPDRRQPREEGGSARRTSEERLAEAVSLAEAIGLDVSATLIVSLRNPVPASLLGAGKVEEIAALVRVNEAELVIVDHPLTPVQQRNLEKAWSAKVLDRTGLILEIFGERAQTKEDRKSTRLNSSHSSPSRMPSSA